MAMFRLVGLAYKLKRGWSRIPPEQRKKLVKNAQKHGPKVARQVGKAVRQVRKSR
jgi:hypothetical protein